MEGMAADEGPAHEAGPTPHADGRGAPRGRWSQDVTEHSDALDLEQGVFTWSDPARIARSLMESAERSTRRRSSSPYRSAMSMLTFYLNRAGRGLDADQRRVLERARDELRALHARGPSQDRPPSPDRG